MRSKTYWDSFGTIAGDVKIMLQMLHDFAERCPDGDLPDSYLVIDVETSGLSPNKNCIVQAGACPVINRQVNVDDSFSLLIKRPPGTMDPGATKVTGITDEMLAEKGVDPVTALRNMHDLFTTYREKGYMFVGHNVAGFDVPFFENDFRRVGIDWKFEPHEVIDTGALVKAARLAVTVQERETLRDFCMRVCSIRAKGIYWALDRYCVPTFRMDKRFAVDTAAAHDAGYDCWVTALLFEDLRRIREMSPDEFALEPGYDCWEKAAVLLDSE
jgi:DNA polymerase III epsilon subunit-like protein